MPWLTVEEFDYLRSFGFLGDQKTNLEEIPAIESYFSSLMTIPVNRDNDPALNRIVSEWNSNTPVAGTPFLRHLVRSI